MPTDTTTLPPSPGTAAARPPLRRTRDDRIVAGVCGGLARTLGVPALAVRLVALAIVVALTPVALVAYAGLAVAMPRDDGRALLGGRPDDRRESVVGVALVVVALIALAAGLHHSAFGGPGSLWLLGLGAVLLVVHHQRRSGSGSRGGPTPHAPPPADAPAGRARHASPYPGPSRPAADPYAPTAAIPAAPPSGAGPREASVGLYGLAAVVGGAVIALVLGAAGAFDATATGVAVGLGAGALALTAAAIVLARRRGAFVLIALAALLGVGAAATAAVGDHVAHGVGERTRLVDSPADLARTQELGIGRLTVDVRRAALTPGGQATVRARLGIGELVIRVPAGVAVVSTGPQTPDGLQAVDDAAGASPSATLRVDADVDAGDLRIETGDR